MMNLNERIEAMKNEVAAYVDGLKVVEMRKAAQDMGIKNVKQFRRPELSKKLIDAIVKIRTQAITAAYEVEVKAAEAHNQNDKKSGKKGNKKSAKSKKDNGDKRYKAAKVSTDDVSSMVNNILSATPAELDAMDLYNVNRKVLIEVMKQLHCKLWYRTYDKPTMVAKITVALGSANKCEEVQ